MQPLLSIVIPVLDESGNIVPLAQEIASVMDHDAHIMGVYEIIFVDDGSTDKTADEVALAIQANPRIRLLRHDVRLGTSTAFRHGVMAARAAWVMTCDGDGQNDPADMPRLLQLAWARGHDEKIIVCGVRVNRQDTWKKRLASKLANRIRRKWLHDGAPDTACALKLFRRDGYLAIPFFTSLHRFMPALFKAYGHEVMHTPINDRLRQHGVSKSDIMGRAKRGLYDLFGVKWLIVRTPQVQLFTEYRPALQSQSPDGAVVPLARVGS